MSEGGVEKRLSAILAADVAQIMAERKLKSELLTSESKKTSVTE